MTRTVRIKAKGTDLDGKPIVGTTFVGTATATIEDIEGAELETLPLVWDATKGQWWVDYTPPAAGRYRAILDFVSTALGNAYQAFEDIWFKAEERPT